MFFPKQIFTVFSEAKHPSTNDKAAETKIAKLSKVKIVNLFISFSLLFLYTKNFPGIKIHPLKFLQ